MIIIKNRTVLVPQNDRYIGTAFDTNSEIRQIQIERVSSNGVDLAALNFFASIILPDSNKDEVLLEKEIQDNYIILTWNITAGHIHIPGTVFLSFRGSDVGGTVRWSCNKAAFYVGDYENTPIAPEGLTVLQQLETKVLDLIRAVSKGIESLQQFKSEITESFKKKTEELIQHIDTKLTQALGDFTEAMNHLFKTLNEQYESFNAREEEAFFQRKTFFNQKMTEWKKTFNDFKEDLRLIFKQLKDDIERETNAWYNRWHEKVQEMQALLDSIREKLANGELKGKDGKDGKDATVHTITGEYSFQVNNEGHLILTRDNGQVIDLGQIQNSTIKIATADEVGLVKPGWSLQVDNKGNLNLKQSGFNVHEMLCVQKADKIKTTTIKSSLIDLFNDSGYAEQLNNLAPGWHFVNGGRGAGTNTYTESIGNIVVQVEKCKCTEIAGGPSDKATFIRQTIYFLSAEHTAWQPLIYTRYSVFSKTGEWSFTNFAKVTTDHGDD